MSNSKRYDRLTEKDQKELEQVLEMISIHHGVMVDDMTGTCKLAKFVRARRHFSIEAQRRHYSLKSIGRYLGGRHHSTILALTRKSDVSVG